MGNLLHLSVALWQDGHQWTFLLLGGIFIICSPYILKSLETPSHRFSKCPANTLGQRHLLSLTDQGVFSFLIILPRTWNFSFTGRIIPSVWFPFPGPCLSRWTNKAQVPLLPRLETVPSRPCWKLAPNHWETCRCRSPNPVGEHLGTKAHASVGASWLPCLCGSGQHVLSYLHSLLLSSARQGDVTREKEWTWASLPGARLHASQISHSLCISAPIWDFPFLYWSSAPLISHLVSNHSSEWNTCKVITPRRSVVALID